MNFEEVLPLVRKGLSIRRTSWAPRLQVRMVDPIGSSGLKPEPEVDGPTEVFDLTNQGHTLERGYEDEASAKKRVAEIKKEHAAAWKRFDDAEKAFADAPVENQEQIKRGATPQFPRDHYKGLKAEKVDAPRTKRLNVPYFVLRDAKSANSPYIFSVSDILAKDWTEA